MTVPAFLVQLGQMAAASLGDDMWRARGGFLRARPTRFAALAVASLLPACATTSMPSLAQGENEGFTGYVACLDAAARRIDDGRSDIRSVAAAVKGMCAARYPEPTSAAARAKSEARQMELSTMVVQDLRGQP